MMPDSSATLCRGCKTCPGSAAAYDFIPQRANCVRNIILRQTVPVALLAAISFAFGCSEQDEVRAYAVPKAVTPARPDAPVNPSTRTPAVAEADGTQLLAAIVPQKDAFWHFKLMGPAVLVKTQVPTFTRFVEGIKFVTRKADDGSDVVEPQWTLPKGWTETPGTGMRYVTITVGDAAHGVELTVFRLGPESGDVLANVQRWAGQVGVENVTKAKLADLTRPITVDNQTATLVDVTGPGGSGGMASKGPTRRPPAPPRPTEAEKITALPPAGWTTDANPGQFLITKYDLTKDGKTASLTISRAGGSPVDNMNRWRQQIALTAWDEQGAMKAFEAQKELREGEVAGRPAMLVDFTGPESEGDKRERTLGALVMSQTGEFWFFKLRGPADLVAAQKDTFDAFLAAVKLE